MNKLIITFLLALMLVGCSNQPKEYSQKEKVFGVICGVVVYTQNNNLKILEMSDIQLSDAGAWAMKNIESCLTFLPEVTFRQETIEAYSVSGCAVGVAMGEMQKLSDQELVKYKEKLTENLTNSAIPCLATTKFWTDVGTAISK